MLRPPPLDGGVLGDAVAWGVLGAGPALLTKPPAMKGWQGVPSGRHATQQSMGFEMKGHASAAGALTGAAFALCLSSAGSALMAWPWLPAAGLAFAFATVHIHGAYELSI